MWMKQKRGYLKLIPLHWASAFYTTGWEVSKMWLAKVSSTWGKFEILTWKTYASFHGNWEIYFFLILKQSRVHLPKTATVQGKWKKLEHKEKH